MSRKLIYISGMLTCFSCELGLPDVAGVGRSELPYADAVCIDCLRRFMRQTPLEILAGTLLKLADVDDLAANLLSSYDGFLGLLSDSALRTHLDQLDVRDQYEDEVFAQARKLTHTFRDALLELFFDRDKQLSTLTKIYGVF